MNKDSILGWILIALVGISLFLSYAIWAQIPGDSYTLKDVSSDNNNLDLAAVTSPIKIVAHLGNSSHTVIKNSSYLYKDIIKYSDNNLALQWSANPPEKVKLNPDYFTHKKGIEVFYPTPLPTPFIKQLLDVEVRDSNKLDDKLIDSYVIIKGENNIEFFLRDENGEYYSIGEGIESDKLDELIDKIAETNPPSYANLPSGNANIRISPNTYVSLLPYELPLYVIDTDNSNEDHKVTKFFTDFSITRRIQEKDGAVIYTDGQKGLRIYPNGALEYNYPGNKEKGKPGFYDAINVAVDFINTHGGWPEDAYLSSFDVKKEDGNFIYKFNFRIRFSGYPVISDEEYFSIIVEGGQVKNFYKNIIRAQSFGESKQFISPIEALDIAVANKNVDKIDDIYPAYHLKDGNIYPVWVVKSEESEIIIPNYAE